MPEDGNRHEKSLKTWEKLMIIVRCLSGVLSAGPICLNALELWTQLSSGYSIVLINTSKLESASAFSKLVISML